MQQRKKQQSNLSCEWANEYENMQKHFIKEVYLIIKDKHLQKEGDQQLQESLKLLSLNSFENQINKSNKAASELIHSNIYHRLIQIAKNDSQKKDFYLRANQITFTRNLINESTFFDILEIEDFNFIKNYLNNQSFYETKESEQYFKNDTNIVKIRLLKHAKNNNLKVVIYTGKSYLHAADNQIYSLTNSIDQKIKVLEDFGIYK